MELSLVRSIMTKLIFRFMLIKRAYTRDPGVHVIARSGFRTPDIRETPTGLNSDGHRLAGVSIPGRPVRLEGERASQLWNGRGRPGPASSRGEEAWVQHMEGAQR